MDFFIYFGGSNCMVYIFRTVCCSLDPVLVIRYVSSCIFLQIQWHFLKLKKGQLGTFSLSQVCWGQKLMLVIFM